jgi:hypothetical protein
MINEDVFKEVLEVRRRFFERVGEYAMDNNDTRAFHKVAALLTLAYFVASASEKDKAAT